MGRGRTTKKKSLKNSDSESESDPLSPEQRPPKGKKRVSFVDLDLSSEAESVTSEDSPEEVDSSSPPSSEENSAAEDSPSPPPFDEDDEAVDDGATGAVLADVKVKLERMPSNLGDLMRKHNIKAIRNNKGELIQRKSQENSPTKSTKESRKRESRGANISEASSATMGKRRPKKVTTTTPVSLSSEDEEAMLSSSQSTAERPPKGETDDSDFDIAQEAAAAATTKDQEDDKEGNSTDSDIVPVKRKRVKKDSAEEMEPPDKEEAKSSSNAKKKRRVRLAKDTESEDSEGEEAKHKRKNIRKVMSHKDLEADTKKATRDEMERRKRLEDRQKLYNQMYNKEIEQVKELDSLVLDFDDETKTELLSVDKQLLKKLKPHQGAGVKFMFDACFESLKRMETEKGSGCILAHCMGLGKTLQVVTLVHTLLTASEKTNVHRVLVICPLSTVLNWVNEFQMWLKHVDFNDDIDIYELSKFKQNNDRAKIIAQWHEGGGVLVLGYDLFRNLSNEKGARIKKKAREQLQLGLVDPGPDLVICDEGHLLKNEKTSLSKAVTKIRTLRRIVLTGTPLQNNLKEYYCMVQFVKPNLLGKYTEYLNRFVNPITNGQYNDSTPRDCEIMKRRSHVLHKLLDGCVQRRDYSVLAPFLPPKHEYVISIRLTEVQCKLYRYYMEHISQRTDPTQKHSSVLFQDYQNLQRIWTHPRVLRYNSDRYEINQAKKMLDEEESDFIDDEDDDDEEELESARGRRRGDANSSSSDSESSLSLARVTRGRAATKPELYTVEAPEPQKVDNPTEWWMEMVPESELDNINISGKLLCLFSILAECEAIGDKLLVFSQSLFSLDVIEHFLGLADGHDPSAQEEEGEDKMLNGISGSWTLGLDYFRLDGSTAIENRNLACKAFNSETNPRARLFLISTRAGGLGINLVAANRVVIFDASWNPSHDVQSIFRVYRFGQTKPCYIYRFLALGTMEEKIYERQVTKQAISKRVLDEQQIDRHYKENDLMELYTFDLEPEEERPVPELPKDRLFAELLQKYEHLIYKYHEHDSLLENKEGETLNEEERKAAWEEFEAEKSRVVINYAQYTGSVGRPASGPVTSNNIFGFRTDILLRLLNLKARKENPAMTDQQINQVIPYLVQQLYRQMANGDLSLYNSLISIQQEFQAHPSMAQFGQFNPPGAYNPYANNEVALAAQQRLYQQQAIRQQQEAQQKMIQARLMAAEAAARAAPSEVIELD